jgi:hypothetical protein
MMMVFGEAADQTKRLRSLAQKARPEGISFVISNIVFENAGVRAPIPSTSQRTEFGDAFFGSSLELSDISVSIPAMALSEPNSAMRFSARRWNCRTFPFPFPPWPAFHRSCGGFGQAEQVALR